MMGLQTVLLLSLGITMAAAMLTDPDCSLCEYFNGIGFLRSTDSGYCSVYFMCIRDGENEGDYTFYTMCCAPGMSFDEEHQTCVIDTGCVMNDYSACPNPTTTDRPCPYSPVATDDSKYLVDETGDIMPCPYGQVWKQDNCTCILGPGDHPAPCDKILNFNFTDSYDSYSCYNFAKGDPYGKPPLTDNMLCFEEGKSQMVSIGYLNNWFAWNPIGKTFTMCFFVKAYAGQTAGVVSTNCYYANGGSVAEFYLDGGRLKVKVGGQEIDTGEDLIFEWTKVCLTFDNGKYDVFVDAVNVGSAMMPTMYPVNSHSATTLGYVKDYPSFEGYMDDFCFWTSVLDDAAILECFTEGPSNP